MKKVKTVSRYFILCALYLVLCTSCDLRQKIAEMPNNIGDFIATRYPALLADPKSEIYEYASVLEYGNENNASLYGRAPVPAQQYGSVDDYIIYSSAGDYVLPDQSVMTKQTISEVATDYGTLVVQEKKSFVLNTSEVTVVLGDTAYSIAKKHNMAVERLAALNNLAPPYRLRTGQVLKVENAEIITTKTEITKTDSATVAAPISAPTISQAPIVTSGVVTKLPKLPVRAGSKFKWPVKGNIISDFGPKRNGLTNDGINISASSGATVAAADNGVVVYAGNELKGMGNLLIIQHAGGWMTVYAHLDSFVVKRGDRVNVGQKIGTVGMTGKVNEPQLHFEIRKGSKAFDPKKEINN